MRNLITYQTWVKKENPKKYQVNDFIGSRTVVTPTLREAGFKIMEDEIPTGCDIVEKPKEFAKNMLRYVDFETAVYHVWWARDYHTRFMTIGYK